MPRACSVLHFFPHYDVDDLFDNVGRHILSCERHDVSRLWCERTGTVTWLYHCITISVIGRLVRIWPRPILFPICLWHWWVLLCCCTELLLFHTRASLAGIGIGISVIVVLLGCLFLYRLRKHYMSKTFSQERKKYLKLLVLLAYVSVYKFSRACSVLIYNLLSLQAMLLDPFSGHGCGRSFSSLEEKKRCYGVWPIVCDNSRNSYYVCYVATSRSVPRCKYMFKVWLYRFVGCYTDLNEWA